MDKTEARERAIGLLTAAYTTFHEGSNTEGFAGMTGPLLRDLLSSSINVEVRDTSDINGIAQAVCDQVAKELEPSVTTLLVTFITAFIALSRKYEEACPDADVIRILQDLAISGSGRD